MTAIVVIILVLAFVVVVCKILIADARRSKKIAQSEHVAEVRHTKKQKKPNNVAKKKANRHHATAILSGAALAHHVVHHRHADTKDLAEYDDPYGLSMDNYYDIDNEPDLYDDYDDGDDDRYLAAREEEQAAYDDFIASMDMKDWRVVWVPRRGFFEEIKYFFDDIFGYSEKISYFCGSIVADVRVVVTEERHEKAALQELIGKSW